MYQQFPQQQMQQFPQQQAPQQQYQQQFQPQQQMQQGPAAPQGLPQFFMPDQQTLNKQYEDSKSGDGPRYVKVPGPGGETKWGNVAVGYEGRVTVWICPVIVQGAPLFHLRSSHFWKSAQFPGGTSIDCLGSKCPICERAKSMESPWTRVRKQWLYNVIVLDGNPQSHVHNGEWRPFILAAGRDLHTAIGSLLNERTVTNIVDPQQGRPVIIKKKKTGPQMMDIEWSAIDGNPQPLPPEYHPILWGAYDLTQVAKLPTLEQAAKAADDIFRDQMQQQGQYQQPQQQQFQPQAQQMPQSQFQPQQMVNQWQPQQMQPQQMQPQQMQAQQWQQTPQTLPQAQMVSPQQQVTPPPMQSTAASVPMDYTPQQGQGAQMPAQPPQTLPQGQVVAAPPANAMPMGEAPPSPPPMGGSTPQQQQNLAALEQAMVG